MALAAATPVERQQLARQSTLQRMANFSERETESALQRWRKHNGLGNKNVTCATSATEYRTGRLNVSFVCAACVSDYPQNDDDDEKHLWEQTTTITWLACAVVSLDGCTCWCCEPVCVCVCVLSCSQAGEKNGRRLSDEEDEEHCPLLPPCPPFSGQFVVH